jgi:hypothetical protein
VRELCVSADVLLENFRPARWMEWNLGPEVTQGSTRAWCTAPAPGDLRPPAGSLARGVLAARAVGAAALRGPRRALELVRHAQGYVAGHSAAAQMASHLACSRSSARFARVRTSLRGSCSSEPGWRPRAARLTNSWLVTPIGLVDALTLSPCTEAACESLRLCAAETRPLPERGDSGALCERPETPGSSQRRSRRWSSCHSPRLRVSET